MTKLSRYLKPPIFPNDEEKTRAAAVLNAMQLALFAVIFVGSIGILLIFTKKGESLLVIAAIFAALVISRILMYKGRVRAASMIFVWPMWIAFTALIVLAGGIKGIDAVYYVTLTVIGGLLLGPRMATIIAILSSLSSLGIAISENLGYALPQFFPILPMTNWFKFFFGLCMVVIPLNMALKGLNDALKLARQEIEERKKAEAALHASEARWRAIFDTATDVAFVVTDADEVNPLITEFSPGAERLFGHRRSEIVGEPAATLFLPEDIDKFPDVMQKMREGEPGFQGEVDVAHRSGDRFQVLLTTHPLFDADGEIRSALGIGVDITERKRAADERERLLVRIQEQARQVQQIIDTVPEGVLLLDAEGCVILANPQGEQDLDVLARASVGDVLYNLGGCLIESLLEPPAGGLWREVETDERSYQITARAIEPVQESRGWLLVIRDVTQQRDIERRAQQQERLAAVGQLAAGIAHDFNNIMATIVLYTQMSARTEGVPADVHKRLTIIHQQAMYATRLIQQILDFSRRAILQREPIDLLSLLNEQVSLLRRTLPENITIMMEHTADDFLVSGSPTSMQQVLMNLAVNARDAMPEGGALHFELEHIRVDEIGQRPLPELTEGDWVVLTVTDTGIGIAPDVLPHIFDPFFTTKAPGEGTGLGLAQVDGIIGMHGGQIDVQTGVDQGTTFILYLPALSAAVAKASIDEPEDGLVVGSGQTILVVEDNAITRTALVDSLVACNYRVKVAENGQRALAVLERYYNTISLVLSDIVMPEMGGIDLLQTMAARGYTVKVVLLTGHPLEAELHQLQDAGADALLADWILKPPDLETLSRVIDRALSRSAQRP